MVDKKQQYRIKLRKQGWIDSGIAGLYNIARYIIADSKYNITIEIDKDNLAFTYQDEPELKELLESCYEELAFRYWNVSTKKQREIPKAVFYNPDCNEFYLRPKRNPTPIPALFTKGSSWRLPDNDSGIAQAELDSSGQIELELFLKENDCQLWSKKKILLLKEPVCHRDLKWFPEEKKRRLTCSICGKLTSNCSDVSQPAFILFASNSATKSFNSEVGAPDKICWECELLGRFAVEAVSYRKSFDDLFILQVVSPDLKKIIDVNNQIGYGSFMRELDQDNFLSNIRSKEKSTIVHSRLSYEFLWAFYSQAYAILKENWESRQNQETTNFLDELLGLSLKDAPIQIILLAIANKGQTFITRDVIFYNDTAFVFRLLHLMDNNNIDPDRIFNHLWVKDEKDKFSSYRNRFFCRVLNKKTVLLETESFAFHVSMGEQVIYLKDLLEFIRIYELGIGGISMNNEQVEVAVNLGKSIVMQANNIVEGTDRKKIKGDLFTLRKTRTKAEFLGQINTLQMRYGLIVSRQFSEGILEDVPFEEFKAYCILGALNTFNSMVKSKNTEGGN